MYFFSSLFAFPYVPLRRDKCLLDDPAWRKVGQTLLVSLNWSISGWIIIIIISFYPQIPKRAAAWRRFAVFFRLFLCSAGWIPTRAGCEEHWVRKWYNKNGRVRNAEKIQAKMDVPLDDWKVALENSGTRVHEMGRLIYDDGAWG